MSVVHFTLLTSWLLLAALAVAHWLLPTGPDQAFYMSSAAALEGGAQLYGTGPTDLTDHHGPGAFLVYLLAASVQLVRRVEVLLWLISGLVSALAFAPALRSRALVAATPWLVAGPYVFGSALWLGGQPASLAAPLLTLGVAAVAAHLLAPDGPRGRRALGGMALPLGGLALGLGCACKPQHLPLALALACLVAARGGAFRWKSAGGLLAGTVVGLGLVDVALGPGTWIRFASEWAAFRGSNIDAFLFPSPSRLADSADFAFKTTGMLAVGAALVGLAARGPGPALVRVWVAGTLLAFLIDMFGWWAFDTWPLLPALGVAALLGLRHAFDHLSLPMSARPVVVAIVIAVSVVPILPRWIGLAQATAGVPTEATLASWEHERDLARLQALGLPSDLGLYVLGDATPLLYTDRPHVSRRHGWAGEIYAETQWEEVRQHFDRRPFLLALDAEQHETVQRRHPPLAVWIASHCEVLFTGRMNDWWHCDSEPEDSLAGLLPLR